MKNTEELSEELLEGWLRMSATIWNRRLVSAMTYNESMVCNLLHKQRRESGRSLTPTQTRPPIITASAGMDTLVHAIEAYSCQQKNPVSDAYATAAIELVCDNLIQTVKNGFSKSACTAMNDGAMIVNRRQVTYEAVIRILEVSYGD